MKKQVIVVAGVSGTGKTTIGRKLAETLHLPFYDADDYHSEANVDKMKTGTALTDQDRGEWLEKLAKKVEEWLQVDGAVLACSALKRSYRTRLVGSHQAAVQVVILTAPFELLEQRISKREGHFMPAELLRSQFDALEIASHDIEVTVDSTPEDAVQEIKRTLGLS